MKRAIKGTRPGLVRAVALALPLIVAGRLTVAAPSNKATITQLINDVRIRVAQTTPHSATIHGDVPDGSSIETGKDSRTELTFADRTVARLSANTICSFKKAARDLELIDGAMLLESPKGAGAAKITTAGITSAVTGTAIVEYHPHAYLKFISLEDTGRVYVKRRWGESVLIRPGQMLITNPDATRLADPVDFNLGRLLNTSLLIVDFPPLAGHDSIARESEKQQRAKSKRRLVDTNLVIFGKGTVVSLTNPALQPGTDTVPSSSDLGTIETPPTTVPNQAKMPAAKPQLETQR